MKIALFVFSLCTLAVAAEETRVTPEKERAFCNVSVMGGSNVTGGRCRFFDEVMTGIVSLDPLTIRCSTVRVTCNRDGKPVEVSMQNETEE